MELSALLVAMGCMGGLGVLFSVGLSIANKKLYVEEDPRIALVADSLPGANCGSCGFAGCVHFAENLVNAHASLSDCNVASDETIEEVAGILGIEAAPAERKVARILCQGGNLETTKKAEYVGIHSCLAVQLLSGGEKLCEYGCLGYGDCVESCPFDALVMNDNGLPEVIDSKCTGCGKCVVACPRGVIELHSPAHRLFVLCRNHDNPKASKKICTRACIGCQICVRAVDEGQMVMDDHLAVVDYTQYGQDVILPTDRCPTECLVILGQQTAQKAETAT